MVEREIKVDGMRIDVEGELLLKTSLLVKVGRYKTRSDVVRSALRKMFEDIDWNDINQIIKSLEIGDKKGIH